MQLALSGGRMFDVWNTLHAWNFSALTVFTWAGNPNKPSVGPTKRPGIVRSNDVIYGGPGFDFIYVHTSPLGISW